MPKCIFKTDEVRRCAEHALNATEWGMGWSEDPPAPRLFFVHDQGVYLMSNGEPRDIITVDGKETTYVAYAENCNPNVDENWWDNSRDLVGGDDFAETITADRDFLVKCGRYENLEIEITPTEIGVYFANPRRIVRAV